MRIAGRTTIRSALLMLPLLASTAGAAPPAFGPRLPQRLPAARLALKTAIHGVRSEEPPPPPPRGVLELVHYDAPLGKNAAYVTPVKKGARRPAIVWMGGGFDWGIDESAWMRAPRGNDQSASVFRDAGFAELYPALRGASGNPGRPECFLGEVDDILAAADFLARRPDVDPARIYLGGHSTGGTLALLAAASSTRFRAVFSFGPIGDVRDYGESGCLPRNVSDEEARARSPIAWLAEIATPTWVIEGSARGNAGAFPAMRRAAGRAPIDFLAVPGGTHFSVLRPGSEVVAKAIGGDTGKDCNINVRVEAISAALRADGSTSP